MLQSDIEYVEVAVPIPVRRVFTYRLPPGLRGRVEIGARVAVPFGRRKLAGIVVARRDEAPGNTKIKEVAGLLDPEPVFPRELLAFLLEAADYYLHPLGEVLRAAAPALQAEAIGELRREGFLDSGESIPGATVATRRVLLVRLGADSSVVTRLGKSQRRVIELLEERGEISINELSRHIKNAHSVARSLQKKGLVTMAQQEAPADPFFSAEVPGDSLPTLNLTQQQAVAAIVRELPLPASCPAQIGPQSKQAADSLLPPTEMSPGRAERRKGAAFLLHGVTGSGKTEVYLRVIAEARSRSLGALVLVPEIALTPQLVARFRARFGDAIAVLHSGLSPKRRNQAWRNLRQGKVNLAIGARSALFAPVQNLGVIVVDEEHDGSFKQEEGFRYHARDMALLRAFRAGAVAILGSATPSLESFYRAEQGKLRLLQLPERATPQQLPRVEVVDLARNRGGPSGHRLLTGPLYQAIRDCLSNRGQSILFLNRRGFAPSVVCQSCGELMQCPGCSVALTAHRKIGLLRCHYCDFSEPMPETCRHCGAAALEQLGLGTERLQEDLNEAFPEARVARLDRDTAAGEGVEKVLDRLREGWIDILVGTQMVAKGHDIPGVTLVGVVLADQSLAFPDFRAAERTFQLLAQVAGRAGRGAQPGRVVVQSYQPDNPAVRCASLHDFLGFYRAELRGRRELGYPPFSRIVAARVDAGSEPGARRAAGELASIARRHRRVRQNQVRLLGPAPAPIMRLRSRYRFRLLLIAEDRAALREVASALSARIDQGLGPARAVLDVDPFSML